MPRGGAPKVLRRTGQGSLEFIRTRPEVPPRGPRGRTPTFQGSGQVGVGSIRPRGWASKVLRRTGRGGLGCEQADLENRYFFVDIRHKSKATTRDIDDAMHLSEDFLQNITDLDGAFVLTVHPCLELARCIKHIAKTSADSEPDRVTKKKQLRAYQLKWLHHLQGRWEDLLQTARDFVIPSPSDACLK